MTPEIHNLKPGGKAPVLPYGKRLAGILTLLWGAFVPGISASDSNHRQIASLDYCADQFVLALAPPEQIAAVSYEADSVYSFFQKMAAGRPTLRDNAEQVMALAPDMLLRQWRGSPETDALYQRAGIGVTVLPFVTTPEEAFDSLVAFGSQIDRADAARQFVKKRHLMQERLAHATPMPVKALYVTPVGYSAGLGTGVDDIIKSAGLQTMADIYGIRGWVPLPLESIVQSPPDVIITSFFDLPGAVSNWSLVHHPRIRRLLETLPVIDLPASYFTCSGLFAIDAAASIRAQAERLELVPQPR